MAVIAPEIVNEKHATSLHIWPEIPTNIGEEY
jgi:hypothetical protein